MAARVPAVACVGIIGKHVRREQSAHLGLASLLAHVLQNNPLHISLFPPDARDALEFSFLLSSSLDVFEARLPHKTAEQDFGLLQAVDERLAMYGWMTNTGVKFVIVVDMEGRLATTNDPKTSIVGLRDADLKPAFKALQSAYIGLLRNPFYDPDQHSPLTANAEQNVGSTQITSRWFINEVKRIGEAWAPGVTSI